MHWTLRAAAVSEDRLLQFDIWKLFLQTLGKAFSLILDNPSNFALGRLEQVLLLLEILGLNVLLSILGSCIIFYFCNLSMLQKPLLSMLVDWIN